MNPQTKPSTQSMSYKLNRLSGSLGAEIVGIDVKHASDEEIAQIQNDLDQHHVLAIRDQQLDPQGLHELARKFGPYSGNPVHTHLDGFDDIVRFVREAEDQGPVIGEFLHMDMPWMETPPGITMLYGEEIPPYGGDTFFASLSAAYDGLSDTMKSLIQDLVGVHTGKGVFAVNAAHKSLGVRDRVKDSLDAIEVEHPLVCRHPNTNRPHLFLSAVLCRFVGMSEAESQPIIKFLKEHAQRVEYTCRLRWAPRTLAMWSNQCLLHAAINDYPGHRRIVLRTTVEGPRPAAAGSD